MVRKNYMISRNRQFFCIQNVLDLQELETWTAGIIPSESVPRNYAGNFIGNAPEKYIISKCPKKYYVFNSC